MIALLRRHKWFLLCRLLAYPAIGMVAGAFFVPRLPASQSDPGWMWNVTFTLLECVILAVAVPFWAAGADGVKDAFARLLIFVTGGCIGALGSVIGFGGVSAVAVLQAQCVALSFGMLLLGLTFLAHRESRWRMQLLATLLGLLMLGSVFYSNAFIEMMPSTRAKRIAISAVLHVNPVVVLTGSIYNYDFLRGGPGRMYDYCVIGPYYPFRYPRWWAASLVYISAGAALVAAARWRSVARGKETHNGS